MQKTLVVMALLASLHVLAQDAPWVSDARKVASSVPPKLLQVLSEEISKGGAVSAIGVCNEKAPQMAKAASEQTGWTIRRVSLRNRNPKAVPDTWERGVLEEFDRRAAAGESPASLEKAEIVTDAGKSEYRYMKALPVQQICLACHGAQETLSPEVSTKLQTLYPHDKAVGYALGQIRGAMTIRKAQ
ncbi:MAG: DUF3365 domain-containing protein [Rhodoferax sp.]|jgi:mono/diheme cytochrome c family protein|nr:DUF3365 domain-containing protein [Rhodoferax sp.]MBP9683972.1 DUF3365 domain-containing protein [Rhodoferax sp.]